MSRWMIVVVVVLAAGVGSVVHLGCAAQPADHEYVTDYRIVGDRTVKYLYLPGERSRAGDMYLDQAIAVEICSIDVEEPPEQQPDEVERGESIIETDCETTRLVKTEEYR